MCKKLTHPTTMFPNIYQRLSILYGLNIIKFHTLNKKHYFWGELGMEILEKLDKLTDPYSNLILFVTLIRITSPLFSLRLNKMSNDVILVATILKLNKMLKP